MRQRMRNQINLKHTSIHRVDRQTHAVYSDRTLAGDVFCQFARYFEGDSAVIPLGGNARDDADTVDVAADDMSVETVTNAQ